MNAQASSQPLTLPFPSEDPLIFDPQSAVVGKVRSSLEGALSAGGMGRIVYLNLDGVELSASVLAALLGPLLQLRSGRSDDPAYLVVVDPAGRNLWDADAALKKVSEDARSKLVCVWRSQDGVSLVGAVDPKVNRTYQFALERGDEGVTARQLAKADGVSIQAASNRLARVSALGLVRQTATETVAGGGNQFRFVAVA